jgi:transcription antitermination factor NusG
MNAVAHAIVDRQPDTGLDRRSPRDYLACYCNSRRSGWIVAVTYPHAEPWALSNLERRGYRPFLVQYAARRRDPVLHTMTHVVLLPLWSGYVFVPYDSRDSWRPIYETPGVRSVLKHRDQIQYVPHGIVEALQATEHVRRSVAPLDASWAPGTPCTLAAGAFRGHDAVVIGTRDGRTLVGVMCFGAMREVSVPADCLMARE